MKKHILFFLGLVAAVHICNAQGSAGGLYYLEHHYQEDPFDDLTYFQAGVNYLSNNVYLGRKDSSALPYLSPYVAYHLFNGFYVKGQASYAPTHKSGHFDLLEFELGYDRTFGDKLLAGASITKDFFQRNSPGIRSSFKESGGIYVQRRYGFLEPGGTFDVNYGRHADLLLGLSLDHDFHIDNNKLNIIPGFTFYLGTQHFYDDYFIRRLKKLDNTLVIDQALDAPGRFRPLDIDASVKVTYRAGGWLFTLVPTYALPFSPATIHLPGRVVTESISNTFFLELDISNRWERK